MKVEAVGVSIQGKRSKNEDNLYFDGKYLPLGHKDSDIWEKKCEDPCCFAVFDGLGGEYKGEMASFLASSHFYPYWNKKDIPALCNNLNEKIVEQQKKNFMGTTIASISITKDKILGFNIGDSRIYAYQEKLSQCSYDHVSKKLSSQKSFLTQCLGVPKTEFMIEPFIFRFSYWKDCIYLICSDGLTSMVSEEEIEKTLKNDNSLKEKLEELIEKVHQNGAHDNTSIILCQL